MIPVMDWTQAVGHGEPFAAARSLPQLVPLQGTWGGCSLALFQLPGRSPIHDWSIPQAKDNGDSLRLDISTLSPVLRLLGLVLSPQGFSRTCGGRSAASEHDAQAWTRRNQRRLYLIDRKYATGLSPLEEAELADLQASLADNASAVAPLPFAALERLETLARAADSDLDSAE